MDQLLSALCPRRVRPYSDLNFKCQVPAGSHWSRLMFKAKAMICKYSTKTSTAWLGWKARKYLLQPKLIIASQSACFEQKIKTCSLMCSWSLLLSQLLINDSYNCLVWWIHNIHNAQVTCPPPSLQYKVQFVCNPPSLKSCQWVLNFLPTGLLRLKVLLEVVVNMATFRIISLKVQRFRIQTNLNPHLWLGKKESEGILRAFLLSALS